jgi:hypothetical protein
MWRATSYRAHSQFAWKSSVPPGDALSRSKMSGFYCGERPPAPDRLRPAEPTQHCRVHPWMGCASWRCRRASCRAIGAHPAGPAAFAHAHGVIAARCAQGAAFARHARRADCVARRTPSRISPRAAEDASLLSCRKATISEYLRKFGASSRESRLMHATSGHCDCPANTRRHHEDHDCVARWDSHSDSGVVGSAGARGIGVGDRGRASPARKRS